MCILFVYTLSEVVSYNDLSVLSSDQVSNGFPKKVWMGVGGWGELDRFILDFLNVFTLQSP